jgi:predicted kinase
VRRDQPETADWRALRETSAEKAGDRQVLQQKLERLPSGHPSSPYQPDDSGDDRKHEPSGRAGDDRDSPDAGLPSADDCPHEPPREPGDADWRPLTDAEHAEHVTDDRARLDKARADGLETRLQHTTDADHEQWSEERAVMHDEIIAYMCEAAHDVPCEHQAILAGGLPGAGKTTVLEQHAGVDRSHYLTINPDDIKAEMAKRGMMPEIEGLTPMEASELAHEESSYIAKQLALRALPGGKNVIWDITMSSLESTEKRIDDLREFGYSRVEAIFVDIPVATSIQRADARHREDHDSYRAGEGLGGRYIAPEIIRAQADPDWGSLNRRTFEQVKPKVDAWRQYDNSVRGRAAQLVDSGGREEDRV